MKFEEPTDYFDDDIKQLVIEMSVESLVMMFALIAIELENRGVVLKRKS
jgi:hypothetical protein